MMSMRSYYSPAAAAGRSSAAAAVIGGRLDYGEATPTPTPTAVANSTTSAAATNTPAEGRVGGCEGGGGGGCGGSEKIITTTTYAEKEELDKVGRRSLGSAHAATTTQLPSLPAPPSPPPSPTTQHRHYSLPSTTSWCPSSRRSSPTKAHSHSSSSSTTNGDHCSGKRRPTIPPQTTSEQQRRRCPHSPALTSPLYLCTFTKTIANASSSHCRAAQHTDEKKKKCLGANQPDADADDSLATTVALPSTSAATTTTTSNPLTSAGANSISERGVATATHCSSSAAADQQQPSHPSPLPPPPPLHHSINDQHPLNPHQRHPTSPIFPPPPPPLTHSRFVAAASNTAVAIHKKTCNTSSANNSSVFAAAASIVHNNRRCWVGSHSSSSSSSSSNKEQQQLPVSVRGPLALYPQPIPTRAERIDHTAAAGVLNGSSSSYYSKRFSKRLLSSASEGSTPTAGSSSLTNNNSSSSSAAKRGSCASPPRITPSPLIEISGPSDDRERQQQKQGEESPLARGTKQIESHSSTASINTTTTSTTNTATSSASPKLQQNFLKENFGVPPLPTTPHPIKAATTETIAMMRAGMERGSKQNTSGSTSSLKKKQEGTPSPVAKKGETIDQAPSTRGWGIDASKTPSLPLAKAAGSAPTAVPCASGRVNLLYRQAAVAGATAAAIASSHPNIPPLLPVSQGASGVGSGGQASGIITTNNKNCNSSHQVAPAQSAISSSSAAAAAVHSVPPFERGDSGSLGGGTANTTTTGSMSSRNSSMISTHSNAVGAGGGDGDSGCVVNGNGGGIPPGFPNNHNLSKLQEYRKSVAIETISLPENFRTGGARPVLAKAPTLQCTSSEEGTCSSVDSTTLFSRTNSAQSLPAPSSDSLYERTLHSLTNDVNVQREVALGKRIGFYRLGKELGSGNFSKVKLGVHVLTKEKVAVKVMEKSKMDVKAQRLLAREIANMELTHHPNVVRLFECVETLSKVFLVMEYAGGGELYHYVHSVGKLTEEVSRPLFAQIVAAIDHLHSKNIVHRDVKAENVIFASTGWVKLADFGFSCTFTDDTRLKTFCGSPPYAAPELFRDSDYVGVKVDVWALGILLYFMLVGVTPFKGETVHDLKRHILAGSYNTPDYLSATAQQLIERMLVMEIDGRATIQELKQAVWLRGANFAEPDLPPSMLLSHNNKEVVAVGQSSNVAPAGGGCGGGGAKPSSRGSGGSNTASAKSTPTTCRRAITTADSPLDEYCGQQCCANSAEVRLRIRHTMRHFGISDETLKEVAERGCRDPIVGTYRIVLYQQQQREKYEQRAKAQERQHAEQRERFQSDRGVMQSKSCSIM